MVRRRVRLRSVVGLAVVVAAVMPVPGVAETLSAPSALIVVGATDGVVTVTSTGGSSDVVLSLRSVTEPVSPTAAVSPFVSQSGDLVEATVDRPKFSGLNGLVRLRVTLPFGTPYTAQLTLSHDGVVDPPVTVTVTRTRTAAPVTIDGVATVSAQSTGLGRKSVVHRLTLTETAGRDLALVSPIVVSP